MNELLPVVNPVKIHYIDLHLQQDFRRKKMDKSRRLTWQPQKIADAGVTEIRKRLDDYRLMNLTVLDEIIARYDRDPGYPFIDTKLNTTSGENFDPIRDRSRMFRGKNAIYMWIQGRGLEALVEHAVWLQRCTLYSALERQWRIDRIRQIVKEVALALETMRERSGGRLFFCMTADAKAVIADNKTGLRPVDLPDMASYTHLFYAKGLLAAGWFLHHHGWQESAAAILQSSIQAIQENRFLNDAVYFKHQTLDGKGICREGPWMIAIGALSYFYEKTLDLTYLNTGKVFWQHLLDHHINRGRFETLQLYDYIDSIDANGNPVEHNHTLVSSPGHALEAIGLSVKLFKQMQRSEQSQFDSVLDSVCALLPDFLLHNFELGYNKTAGGIQLAMDLYSRQPVNKNMPWWPLPETLRAAAAVLNFCATTSHRDSILKILQRCCNDFMLKYVNPNVHLMAIQMRDESGRSVDAIPATPDADPAYHTGLSVIDFIDEMERASD